MTPTAVPSLFDAGWLTGGQHPLALGPTEQIPYLRDQTRVNFARAGVIDPLSIADYQRTGGFAGLAKALAMSGQQAVDVVKASGLRGRGGAAFPPASSGRPCSMHLRRRSTSSATPTRAIPAPSPTAC